MTPKRVLVINLGWEQKPLIRSLIEAGSYQLFGVHDGEDAHEADQFRSIVNCSYFDFEAILEFARRNRIEAIISDQCDYSLMAQALVADAMGLPGPRPEAALLSNNKLLQRQRSDNAGILIPKYQICYSQSDIARFASKFGYPVIVKPVDNRGSIGVTKVNDALSIESAFFNGIQNSRSQLCLVEEFIDGIQFTVDGYAFRNIGCKTLAIGSKIMLSEDIQVAMGISYPANLTVSDYERLASLNETVNEKLGYQFGMTHTEYMLRNGEFYLVESANRGGGCMTSEIIVPAVTNYDLVGKYISDCFGLEENTEMDSISQNPVTLRFFSVKPGRFKCIKNWDSLARSPGCLYSRLNLSRGDSISPITNDGNRHGFLIIDGDLQTADLLVDSMEASYFG